MTASPSGDVAAALARPQDHIDDRQTAAIRQELRRLMQALGAAGAVLFDRYGATELGSPAQCREEGEWHDPAPELLFLEIVDPDTGLRQPDGERGALALTQLSRGGTVLIRFLVGDVASPARGPCPHCGRASERVIGPVVRAKDIYDPARQTKAVRFIDRRPRQEPEAR